MRTFYQKMKRKRKPKKHLANNIIVKVNGVWRVKNDLNLQTSHDRWKWKKRIKKRKMEEKQGAGDSTNLLIYLWLLVLLIQALFHFFFLLSLFCL